MITRRVTRSTTRANAGEYLLVRLSLAPATSNQPPATVNNAPAPPPAAINTTQAVAVGTTEAIKTRSGRVLGQVVATAQKLVRGRRGRNQAEGVASGAASTSTAYVLSLHLLPDCRYSYALTSGTQASTKAATAPAPPRKRVRKDTPATASSSNAYVIQLISMTIGLTDTLLHSPEASTNAPAPAAKTTLRKRAPPKKQAATTSRARSNKGKAKALSPPPSPKPEVAALPAADASEYVPKSEADFDKILEDIRIFKETELSDAQIKATDPPQWSPMTDLPRFQQPVDVLNLFRPAMIYVENDPARKQRVREQWAAYNAQHTAGSASGTAENATDDIEDLSEPESSQFESSPSEAGEAAQQPQVAGASVPCTPVVFPTISAGDREVEAPRVHPKVPGAVVISRQYAHIYDKDGRPVEDGYWPSFTLPEHAVDATARKLKAISDAPYPETWHGSIFDPEPSPTRRRQLPPPNANVSLLRRAALERGLAEAQASSSVSSVSDDQTVRPLNWSNFNEEALASPTTFPSVAGEELPPLHYVEPRPEVIEKLKQFNVTPLRRQSHFNLLRQQDESYETSSSRALSPTPVSTAASAERPVASSSTSSDAAPVRRGAPLRRGAPMPPPPELWGQGWTPTAPQASPSRPIDPRRAIKRQGAFYVESPQKSHTEPEPAASASSSTDPAVAPIRRGAPLRRGAPMPLPPELLIESSPRSAPQANPIDPRRAIKRQGAFYIPPDSEEVPRQAAATVESEPAHSQPASTMTIMEREKRVANVRALSKTPSSGSLRNLGSARSGSGTSVAFSRAGSESSIASQPTKDKGKGRAVSLSDVPEETATTGRIDKGKKPARSEDSDDSEEAADEVERSLVVEEDDTEDEEMDVDEPVLAGLSARITVPLEEALLPGWPKNYVRKQGLFTVEVYTTPMSKLPVKHVKRTRSDVEAEEASDVNVQAEAAPEVKRARKA